MCGICGIISSRQVNKHVVKQMNNSLIHRGPDGEGFYEDDGLAMAMRRLSIIDLQGGWQPLSSIDNSVILMINGEIYNYKELQETLVKKGHRFKTNADGETIVHLYEEYGIDCLQHLRGMFAFALWDKNKKQLMLARDRMGEKPLYLFQQNDTLVFSSELHSLMSSGLIDFELDLAAIDLFFHYHYVPEPSTPIKKIRKLQAGHLLVIDQDTMSVTDKCYWRLDEAPQLRGNPLEIIKDQLFEVSRMVIRSDVPVGVALSGGIDSAAIAALAAKFYNGNLNAFTVGYEGRPESDERTSARKVAEFLGIPFHEIEISDSEFIKNFPQLCTLTDDPIADISAFGYYSVSKAAREHGVPVLLQGHGGDELFWGYPWVRNNYEYVKLKKKLRENDPFVFLQYYKTKFKERYSKKTLIKFIKGILSFGESYNIYRKHKYENRNIFPFYDYIDGFNWTLNNYEEFYGKRMVESKNLFNPAEFFTVKNEDWQYPEITLTKLIASTYLLENGIAQGDRLSMSNSVELRLPLVDYKLAETVIGLRRNIPDISFTPKYWLNESVKDLLPASVFNLRKRGFEPPVQTWLNGILQNYGNLLPDGELVKQGIINKNAGIRLSEGMLEPKAVFPAYFNALVMEFWLRTFIH